MGDGRPEPVAGGGGLDEEADPAVGELGDLVVDRLQLVHEGLADGPIPLPAGQVAPRPHRVGVGVGAAS
jgi:hypothetical protein